MAAISNMIRSDFRLRMYRCRFCGLSVFSGADAVYQYVVSGAVIVSDCLPCHRR